MQVPQSARSRVTNSKERRKRALIGAGVGALAGGAVGNYMDRQEAKLRAQLQGTGVSVSRSGENIVLNMPGNITFGTGSSDLNANFFNVLDSVALVLKEYDKTDHRRDRPYGQRRLGSDQPGAVRASGRHRRHVPEGEGRYRSACSDRRLSARPIQSRRTTRRTARQQNRRVELTLTPITGS